MDAHPTPTQLREQKAFEDWRAEQRRLSRRSIFRQQVLVHACAVLLISGPSLSSAWSSLLTTFTIGLALAICLYFRLDQLPTLLIVAPMLFLVYWPLLFPILMHVVTISAISRFYALRLDR